MATAMGRVAENTSRVANVFRMRPERVAAAWRRLRSAQHRRDQPLNLLIDGVVVSFIRALGEQMNGSPKSPWSQTEGLLRLSSVRGTRGLYDEFGTLRQCLVDAAEVLDGSLQERQLIDRAIDEAVDASVAMQQRLVNPQAEAPRIQFRGIVLEMFERPPADAQVTDPMVRTVTH